MHVIPFVNKANDCCEAVAGSLVDAGPLITPQRQQELKSSIDYIMKKLEEDALHGELHNVMADDDLAFEAVNFQRNEGEFTCDAGSMLRDLACGKLKSWHTVGLW